MRRAPRLPPAEKDVSTGPRTQYIIGETWLFDIGVATIEQRYESVNSMHYRIASGARAGVEDFAENTFYSHATLDDGKFMRVHGSMRRLG